MTLSSVLIALFLAKSASGLFFNEQVCYDDTGCFSSEGPFKNALGELPDSPDEVQVRAFLWTQQNPRLPQELDYHNVSSIKSSNFDSSRPTKILIHGFMSSKDKSPIIANLSVAFLKKDDFNVIGIDWSKGAAKFYPKAVANTRLVGAVAANLLKTLITEFDLKLQDLHVLGHSLGAHISGYIGTHIPGISRITGLDPAGPLFAKSGPKVRLDPTDAKFVDVIHSDGAPLEDAGFGTLVPFGDMDFYPNGGQYQPGCPPPIRASVEQLLTLQLNAAFDSVSCAHDRAIWYFIESVLNTGCDFVSYPCSSWEEFKTGSCNSCIDGACAVMGVKAANDQPLGQVTYYLNTNPSPPFCGTDHVLGK